MTDMLDADGKRIDVGSVLVDIEDPKRRGVVVRIYTQEDRDNGIQVVGPVAVGDMEIARGPGDVTFSCQYDKWRHVPDEEQTYTERFRSSMAAGFQPDENMALNPRLQKIMWVLLDLFPKHPVDWEWGPWPDSPEDVIGMLAEHLDELNAKPEEDKS